MISVVTQRGTLVVGIAYGYPYYKGSAIFSLVFFQVSQVKNRLFPTKPLPLCKPIRIVQFGQESRPAGENLQLKNKKTNIENNCDMLRSVCFS